MSTLWDTFALFHYQRLNSEKDITFHKVFLPVITEFLQQPSNSGLQLALDAGCGTGYLTHILSNHAREVIGLDTSPASIEIAKKHNQGKGNIEFELIDIKAYTENHIGEFDLVLSHLVLHIIEDFHSALRGISRCLKTKGRFLFSIPHPCFWAQSADVGTWNFVNTNNYKYHIDSTQKNSIRLEGMEFSTPHYHRKLQTYTTALKRYGFVIDQMIEPIPDSLVMKENGKNPWPYPRFLFIECTKN